MGIERKSVNGQSEKTGYVASGLPVPYKKEYGPVVDLGLAANPLGPAVKAGNLTRHTFTKHLARYDSDVHHKDVKELIIAGIGLRGIDDKCVILHPNGSYGAGDEVVRALSNHARRELNHQLVVYAPSYSFPNVQQYTARHGAEYRPLPSGKDLFQSESLKSVLAMGSTLLKDNVVYIDYPNNPTGMADASLLRRVVGHVNKNGGVPFVDLAFGEVLGDEFRDAIQYTLDRGGVCVGSLTKTQGLPALRAGYMILNKQLAEVLYNGDTRLVFGLPAHVKQAYQLLFPHKGYSRETLAQKHGRASAKYNRETNGQLYDSLKKVGVGLAPTIPETPIQVLINQGDNLYARLACTGIKSESLAEYSGTLKRPELGFANSAVRVLTPRVGELKSVIVRIQKAMDLPNSYIKERWNENNS